MPDIQVNKAGPVRYAELWNFIAGAGVSIEMFADEVPKQVEIRVNSTQVMTDLGGGGDTLSYYYPAKGQVINVAHGTAAQPDTDPAPVNKASRTVALPASTTGNPMELAAASTAVVKGVNPGAIQPVGIVAFATNESTVIDTRNDVLAISGFAEVTAPGSVNAAEGGYMVGRRSVSTAFGFGMEIQSQELVADQNYSPLGYQKSQGIAIDPGVIPGSFRSAAAIVFGRSGSPAFDALLAVPAFAAAGDGLGPARTHVLVDSGKSQYTLYVDGVKGVAPIALAAGVGPILQGETTRFNAGAYPATMHEMRAPAGADADPALLIVSTGATDTLTATFRNAAGSSQIGVSGGSNYTGALAGSLFLKALTNAKNVDLVSGGQSVIRIPATGPAIAFFNGTGAGKQAISGSRGGNAALASLLTALATLGLVTDSTTA